MPRINILLSREKRTTQKHNVNETTRKDVKAEKEGTKSRANRTLRRGSFSEFGRNADIKPLRMDPSGETIKVYSSFSCSLTNKSNEDMVKRLKKAGLEMYDEGNWLGAYVFLTECLKLKSINEKNGSSSDSSIDDDSDSPLTQKDTEAALLHNRLFVCCFALGRCVEVLVHNNYTLKNSDDEPMNYINSAQNWMKLGRYDQAFKILDEALSLIQDYPFPYVFLFATRSFH